MLKVITCVDFFAFESPHGWQPPHSWESPPTSSQVTFPVAFSLFTQLANSSTQHPPWQHWGCFLSALLLWGAWASLQCLSHCWACALYLHGPPAICLALPSAFPNGTSWVDASVVWTVELYLHHTFACEAGGALRAVPVPGTISAWCLVTGPPHSSWRARAAWEFVCIPFPLCLVIHIWNES